MPWWGVEGCVGGCVGEHSHRGKGDGGVFKNYCSGHPVVRQHSECK